jgi:hypothetical protein
MAESRVAIETLAALSDYAFEGDSDESLMANLHDMREGDRTALPPGAERTIADVLEHVGWRNGCMRTMPSDQGRCAAMNRRSPGPRRDVTSAWRTA